MMRGGLSRAAYRKVVRRLEDDGPPPSLDELARLAELSKHRLTPASSMRVAVADAMRRSWTRPLATVALPVVLDRP